MAQLQNHFLPLLLLLISLAEATAAVPPPPPINHPQALVAPITKDPLTSLYTIPLNNNNQQSHFLLDITGPFLWSSPCSSTHPTIPCNDKACFAAHAFPSPHCPAISKPHHPCTCTIATPANPVTGNCTAADLTLTHLTLSTTDGRNPTAPIAVTNFVSSCASSPTVFKSLPSTAVGVAGLARSALALPSQLSTKLSIKRQFAICLPSTAAAPGVAFFGDKPFHLLPPTQPEATTFLSYTKLKKNKASPDYFLPLEAIAVNGALVPFLARVLEFDSLGHGGVKLSTAAPYTALRTHVYRPFLEAYAAATRGIPRARKVPPFDLCLKTSALGSTRVGPAVPQIDLVLDGGRNWTVFGANAFKDVGGGASCLAFVDGGPKAAQAVTVGAFQMEDNFLLFDLPKSRLGFSSSLLFFRTTCGNFNFTSGV